jgi:glycerophosphoryl diester phosphodiesterase
MNIKHIVLLFQLSILSTLSIHPFLIIGHRGACGYEPENTLVSFSRAIKMGVDMIELDVYTCKTGELVIYHDPSIALQALPGYVIENKNCTAPKRGNIVDMNFADLRKLKIAGTEQIPTLQEVIDLVARRVPINIELKGPGTAQPVAKLIKKYLKKGWVTKDFVASSFDLAQILQFKKLCPNIETGTLFSWNKMPENITVVAKKYKADFIGLDVKAVTADMVQQAHAAGFSVYVWTVNDQQTANTMRALKVDGIFANYPDRVSA